MNKQLADQSCVVKYSIFHWKKKTFELMQGRRFPDRFKNVKNACLKPVHYICKQLSLKIPDLLV